MIQRCKSWDLSKNESVTEISRLHRQLSGFILIVMLVIFFLGGQTDAKDAGLDAFLPHDLASSGLSASAEDLLVEIESGESLNLSGLTIIGSLDLSRLSEPVRQSIRITNSRFLGAVRMESVTFAQGLDLRG